MLATTPDTYAWSLTNARAAAVDGQPVAAIIVATGQQLRHLVGRRLAAPVASAALADAGRRLRRRRDHPNRDSHQEHPFQCQARDPARHHRGFSATVLFVYLVHPCSASSQASLSIPTPYAFNYHLDPQGNFRGLAFANFRAAPDADAVVAALNGFDVQGRKLRVEYKKVLQAGEKERIEREKALRRMRSMQLEKEQQGGTPFDDFGPVGTPAYNGAARPFPTTNISGYGFPPPQTATSPPIVGSLPQQPTYLGGGPPPFPTQPTSPGSKSTQAALSAELDLNDPSTLEIYSRILLFKDDRMRDELAFSRSLAPKERRVVHLIAKKLGLYHYSVGEGAERYAVVTRVDPEGRVSLFVLACCAMCAATRPRH